MRTALLALPAAHAICVALLLVDSLARGFRLRRCVRSFGGSVGLLHAIGANLVEDAGAAITPMRLGGQPARLGMLKRADVETRVIVVASVVETALTYPLLLVLALSLSLLYGAQWWQAVGPRIAQSTCGAVPWLIGGSVLFAISWWALRSLLPRHHTVAREALGDGWRDLRQLDRWTITRLGVASLVSASARVAILPVLVATRPDAPSVGATVLGSFVLLYGQIVLPTPSGAGAVDSGFVSGGAGVQGAQLGGLLLVWRLYTSLLPVAVGALLAAPLLASLLHARRLSTPSHTPCDPS